nr:hypothetical protein Iba_chr09fCG6850 [Ipomoea batatas]
MAVESGGATTVKMWWSTTSGVSTAGESPNFGNFIKSPEINMKMHSAIEIVSPEPLTKSYAAVVQSLNKDSNQQQR